jgi:hypothetical protein
MHDPLRTLALTATLALAAAGCGPAPTPPLVVPGVDATAGPAATAPALASVAELEQFLSDHGVQMTFESEQDLGYLDVPGRIYRLAGQDSLEVHTYPDAATALAVSRRVAPNGRSIGDPAGGSIGVEWLGTPHFFRSGPLIVVYVGKNPDTLQTLTRALGPPFAGG